MKASRLLSPIGIFITILLVNTFSQNGYIGLVDASNAKAPKLFPALGKLLTLKSYLKRLKVNSRNYPHDKNIDDEIRRTQEKIREIEGESSGAGFTPAGEVFNRAELRISGLEAGDLVPTSEDESSHKGTSQVKFPGHEGQQEQDDQGQKDITYRSSLVVQFPGSEQLPLPPYPEPIESPVPSEDPYSQYLGPSQTATVESPVLSEDPYTQFPGPPVPAPVESPVPSEDPYTQFPGPPYPAPVESPVPSEDPYTQLPGPPYPAPVESPVPSEDPYTQLPGPPYPAPVITPSSVFSKSDFQKFWNTKLFPSSSEVALLNFGTPSTSYNSFPAFKRAFARYVEVTSNGVQHYSSTINSLSECKIISERNILFLQAFIAHFTSLSEIPLSESLYCLIFTNSTKPSIGSFITNFKNYLNNNGYPNQERNVETAANLSMNYLAAKSFSRKQLTVTGVKKLVKDNKELANECGVDEVTFATSVLLLSDIYAYNIGHNSYITLTDICSVLKGYQDPSARIFELTYLFQKLYLDDEASLLNIAVLIKESLESAYRALSIPFSDYFLDSDQSTIKKLTPMQSSVQVEDIVGQTSDLDDVIRTSSRHVTGKIPIPEIPGPPSRRRTTGTGVFHEVPTQEEILKPLKTSTDYQPFKKSSVYPSHPENLPEKASGRGFVKSLKTHMTPRDYETQFLYGSSGFVGPQLTYFKRVSEREYAHDAKIKQAKEEQKRLEKKREQRVSRGYKDLRNIKEGGGAASEESVSELPEVSEEPSPLPEMDDSVKQIPSRFETKLHKLVPKTSSIYTQPSQKFRPTPLTYTTLKPSKNFEPAPKQDLDFMLGDESSEGTIGLPSRKEEFKDRHTSPESEVSKGIEDLSISEAKPILTTEIAVKDVLLKCPDLTKPQKKRAVNLFRILKYLYNGSSAGWYITAFCRAVYFAEKDVCISAGPKSLNIRKMASECYASLGSAPFISKNPELSNITRQVCYSYYKKRAASVCVA